MRLKSLLLFSLCFLLLPCISYAQATNPVPTQPSIIKVNTNKLTLALRKSDGSLSPTINYIIKGVTWDPATSAPTTGPDPNGSGSVPYGFFFDWPGRNPPGYVVHNYWKKSEFNKRYKTDLALIAAMKVNTIRVYGDMGTSNANILNVLNECYRLGIMVVMTIANSKEEFDNQSYLNKVIQFKNHPAILMWALGNEWNFNNYYGYATILDAINATNAAALAIKNIDKNHPVSSSLGDRFELTSCPVNDPCCSPAAPMSDIPTIVNNIPAVDIWGLNIYRGNSFNNLFNQWKTITNKPFYIGEFGVDSYSTSSYTLYGCGYATQAIGNSNQQKQSEYDTSLWQEIVMHLSAINPNEQLAGGFVHQFNDALWKIGSYHAGLGGIINYNGPDNIAGTADDNKSYAQYNNEGFILGGAPDRVSNEEFYGLVTSSRIPKASYVSMQDLYTNLPNLLVNADFENQKNQWISNGAIDPDVHLFGNYSLKLSESDVAYSNPKIKIVPNRTYLISGWILPTVNATVASGATMNGIIMHVYWYDQEGNLISKKRVNPYVVNINAWQFYLQGFTSPANAVQARIFCQVDSNNLAWFDRLSMTPN